MRENNMFNKLKLLCFITISLFLIVGCSNLDVQKLNEKAAELMQQGDVDGAIARLESIQDLNPNFPQTNYNLGIAYKEKKQYEKSELYLERAIELKPDFYQAYLALSVVNEELANHIITTLPDITVTNNSKKDLIKPEEKEKLVNYLKKAKKSLEEYIKYSKNTVNQDTYSEKLKEYDANIEKYTINTLQTTNEG